MLELSDFSETRSKRELAVTAAAGEDITRYDSTMGNLRGVCSGVTPTAAVRFDVVTGSLCFGPWQLGPTGDTMFPDMVFHLQPLEN